MTTRWALILALAASACGGAVDHAGDQSLNAELRLSPTPPMVGSAGISVRATDGGVPVVPPGAVSVSLGDGEGPPAPLEFEGGAWVGRMDFPAPGEVRVEVRIRTADDRWATLRIPVRVVRRP